MQAIFRHEGKAIDYTPQDAVSAGDVIVLDDLVTIAKLDIPAGELGAVATRGVFDVVKVTGALNTLGAPIYWDDDANPVGGEEGSGAATATSAGNKFMGWVVATAASGDERVRITLNSLEDSAELALDDLSNVGDDTATAGNILVADGSSWESVAVSGDATLAGDGELTLNEALAEQVAYIPIENLSAGDDIAARPVFADPRGCTITSVALIAQGAFAGVDAGNTMVVTLDDGSDAIVTKTYSNVTVPDDNDVNDLGAPAGDFATLAADQVARLTITNGSTADPPAMLLRVGYRPTNAA